MDNGSQMEIAGQVAHGRRMDGLAVAQRDAVEITEPRAVRPH